jgi:polyisoprenoid-binding protein YceI
MKKVLFFFAVLAGCSFISAASSPAHTDVYKVNVAESKLEWAGKKVNGEHKGTIQFKSGELNNDHGKFTGTFEIDMTTISNTDLTGNSKERLENHLKSDDFFGVEKFPLSKFVVASVTPLATRTEQGHTHLVSGNLTIRDKTNPISFNVVMETVVANLVFRGETTIDRSKYNVRYGSKTFFENIGDKMIYDEFTLKFNVVLNK